jgi:hypothetical protein
MLINHGYGSTEDPYNVKIPELVVTSPFMRTQHDSHGRIWYQATRLSMLGGLISLFVWSASHKQLWSSVPAFPIFGPRTPMEKVTSTGPACPAPFCAALKAGLANVDMRSTTLFQYCTSVSGSYAENELIIDAQRPHRSATVENQYFHELPPRLLIRWYNARF